MLIKKLLPTLITLVLLDININFITGVARVLSKRDSMGLKGGPRLKREGPELFLDLN